MRIGLCYTRENVIQWHYRKSEKEKKESEKQNEYNIIYSKYNRNQTEKQSVTHSPISSAAPYIENTDYG